MIYTADASSLKDAFISGANNLCNNKDILNDLNVFPVPDGDTGSNMSMTVMAAVRDLNESNPGSVSDVFRCISGASLRGARGNSGVILSQLFRGMSKSLSGKETANAEDISDAFSEAVNAAYRAVMKPAEGTILSVTRETAKKVAEALKTSGEEKFDIKKLIEIAVDEAQKNLDMTPELLPQLKQAGVVDAGAQGVLYILRGVLSYLETGEILPLSEGVSVKPVKKASKAAVSDIEFCYCTEFLINKKYTNADSEEFSENIKKRGDSMVVIDDEGIIKVHIHTNHPGWVIEQALKLGELTNLKIDNMRYQHNNLLDEDTGAEPTETKEDEPHKEYGFAAVAAGDGFASLLKDLEIDRIIEGGQTMNPSTDDILNAVKDINADTVFIFPNNKNIIMAAQQVENLSDKKIIVIPTRSIPECISAKLSFAPDMSIEDNTEAMNEVISSVKTGSVTYSVRSFAFEDKEYPKDKILGLSNGKITNVGDDISSVAKELVSSMADEESAIISIYYGSDIKEDEAEELCSFVSEKYPNCDVAVYNGGQPVYYYILSVE